MKRRVVLPLKFAAQCARPDCIPVGRPRGVKQLGIQYERKLARALPGCMTGPWFMFQDQYNMAYCQPDIVINKPDYVVVIECKLKFINEAIEELTCLYLPVVEMALRKPARGIIAVKNLVPKMPMSAFSSIRDAELSAMLTPALWHWLPGTPVSRDIARCVAA